MNEAQLRETLGRIGRRIESYEASQAQAILDGDEEREGKADQNLERLNAKWHATIAEITRRSEVQL